MADSQVEILWVHDFSEGPLNGLASYRGEKLWFDRQGGVDRFYVLKRVAADDLQRIESQHQQYCEATGAPLTHGGPRRIKRRAGVSTAGLNLPPQEEGYQLANRSMSESKRFDYRLNPLAISGEIVRIIHENEFSNYWAPQPVVVE